MKNVRRRVARDAVAAGAAAAFVTAAQPAAQANWAPPTLLVCDGYIDIYNIQIPGYVNCMLDYTGAYVAYLGQWAGDQITRVGNCVFYYDPLFPPFPGNIVPATVWFANCVV
jgi:hypothetical protein